MSIYSYVELWVVVMCCTRCVVETSAKTSENTNGRTRNHCAHAFTISVNSECFLPSLQSFRLTHDMLVLGSCTHTTYVFESEKDVGGSALKRKLRHSVAVVAFVRSFFNDVLRTITEKPL
ncbi:hypothetical protein PsorP6_008759 [Peronosclerospora sorghi]|uniref:Uncharacterized protein n=1 Tax=Peronosclerospora sorghi TaxID=230839 RepID=A0ACC0VZR9_9STRA|nr:hypothetical protein PsorP6_008759 [Peronosclerospora sorghi]